MSAVPPLGKTILVVEDNAVTREGLAAVLRQHCYDVFTAENGWQALSLLQDGVRPNVILLDMLMPVLDGWHFLEQLQAMPLKPAPCIIVATGTALTREWAVDHGCAGFLKKPIDEVDLVTEIRCCLGE